MKAAIYNPYWDTLGGGERYTISFAKVLAENGFQVDLQWKDKSILKKIENRFGIKTDAMNVVPDVKKGEGYDIIFWVSDGSIPLLHSRKNIIHFQVPFKDVNGDSLLNRMKLFRVYKIICNSNFTKRVIDNEYRVKSTVIYPPCDTTRIKPKRKENIILSVGRFSQLLQSKHQDVLIDVFKKLYKKGFSDWKLVLVGGTDVGVGEYINTLKERSKGYPVEFITNTDYKTLVRLFGISKVFWTASGYGEDEEKNPEKVEHFGIALIEAMAGGCIVFAVDSGGHREIIRDFGNGFLWNTPGSLMKKMVVMTKGKNSGLVAAAVTDAKSYSYENFGQNVKNILQL